MALGTTRVLKVTHRARKIARIDVTKASLPPNLRSSHERFWAGVVRISHLVVFVKGSDVPRNIRRHADQKLRQAGQFIVGVIEAWDNQGEDLQPEAHLIERRIVSVIGCSRPPS